jgi:hypothetical protein
VYAVGLWLLVSQEQLLDTPIKHVAICDTLRGFMQAMGHVCLQCRVHELTFWCTTDIEQLVFRVTNCDTVNCMTAGADSILVTANKRAVTVTDVRTLL